MYRCQPAPRSTACPPPWMLSVYGASDKMTSCSIHGLCNTPAASGRSDARRQDAFASSPVLFSSTYAPPSVRHALCANSVKIYRWGRYTLTVHPRNFIYRAQRPAYGVLGHHAVHSQHCCAHSIGTQRRDMRVAPVPRKHRQKQGAQHIGNLGAIRAGKAQRAAFDPAMNIGTSNSRMVRKRTVSVITRSAVLATCCYSEAQRKSTVLSLAAPIAMVRFSVLPAKLAAI